MKSCSIVIVNWNSGEQLKDCLDSISNTKKTMFKLDRVVVVDNASSDNSAKNIKLHDVVEVIKKKKNLGFSKACNIGASKVNSDFILFLNPDTLLYKDTLDILFQQIKQEDEDNIGIYGVQLQDSRGEIQRTCARFPSVWNFLVRSLGLNKINSRVFQSYAMHDWDHKESKIVDEVIGAFFLVKSYLFRDLGGFNEAYFVYYEELDFAKRSHTLGYKTKYIAESQAFHKGGGVSEQVKAKRLFYNLKSRMIYSFEHFGKIKGLFVMLITMILEPFSRLVFLSIKRNKSEIYELISGYKMLLRSCSSIIKKGFKK
jgi:GT2 family glycosyltransferase